MELGGARLRSAVRRGVQLTPAGREAGRMGLALQTRAERTRGSGQRSPEMGAQIAQAIGADPPSMTATVSRRSTEESAERLRVMFDTITS